LESPYPSYFSIEIDGEAMLEGENVVFRTEFIESYTNRLHLFGGTRGIDG
jgi:hypothetical protein